MCLPCKGKTGGAPGHKQSENRRNGNLGRKGEKRLRGAPWGSFLRLLFFFGLCQFMAGGPLRPSYDNHAGPPAVFFGSKRDLAGSITWRPG